MRFWYLSHPEGTQIPVSLCKGSDSPEPLLLPQSMNVDDDSDQIIDL